LEVWRWMKRLMRIFMKRQPLLGLLLHTSTPVRSMALYGAVWRIACLSHVAGHNSKYMITETWAVILQLWLLQLHPTG
jgi:hypothetical protein